MESENGTSKAHTAALEEIISCYIPSQKAEPDYMPTSQELCEKVASVVTVEVDEMTALLIKYGFHLRLELGTFRWAMDFI